MVHGKTKYKIIIYTILCTLVLFSCKKEAKEPIGARIYAVMAHNGQPISGIKWKVVEFEAKFSGDIKSTDWEKNGETDGAGLALIEFHPKKNMDFIYDVFFDYSSMSVPTGDYVIIPNLSFDRLVREYMTAENTYEIRILPKMDVQIHFKNVNCYDSQDSFKFKYYNVDEFPYYSQGQINSIPWFDGSAYSGCLEMNWNGSYLAGHYVFFWEATRNGILETGIDTFYVSPDGNNLIEMFW